MRRRRRSRLRVAAGPRERPSANATRGGVSVGSATNVHQRTPARKRCPSAPKRRNEACSRTRQIKPTAGAGPCPGATSERPCRPACSSARGSRASSPGGGCSVETCASRSPPCAAPGRRSCWYEWSRQRRRRPGWPIAKDYGSCTTLPTSDDPARSCRPSGRVTRTDSVPGLPEPSRRCFHRLWTTVWMSPSGLER